MSLKMPSGRFFGKRSHSYSAANLLLVENLYEPRFTIPKHCHELPHIAFVVRGSYTETLRSTQWNCIPSTLLFQPAGEEHSEQHDDNLVSVFNLQITAPFLEYIRRFATLPSQPHFFRTRERTHPARRLYHQFKQADPLLPLAAEAFTLACIVDMCGRPLPEEKGLPSWLLKARELLHAQFHLPISLSDIAAEVDIHPVHLSRTFLRHFGCSLMEYMRQLRVESAKKQLVSSGHSLTDIAALAGYSDQSQFTTTFKRYTGLTPGAYRKSARTVKHMK